jgi:hypothetical protein
MRLPASRHARVHSLLVRKIMFQRTLVSAAVVAACAAALPAFAASDQDLAQLHAEIRQMKQDYEARIQALEHRLQATEEQAATAPAQTIQPPVAAGPQLAPVTASGPSSSPNFLPDISLILGGTYANLSQDPNRYRLQGFFPNDGIGPGPRGFNLGESELTLRANIDPQFAGQLTFSLDADNAVSVEEAFFRTQGLSDGLNLKAGRFLSSIGYLNSQHAHAWDFVDAPLAYQAFLGGQYKPDGVQATWLAPTERFLELGAEAGSGRSYPGNDRNKNGVGAWSLFGHLGDDIGESASWRAGLSYLDTGATAREFADVSTSGSAVTNAFTGHSNTWVADAIFKWAPHGNATRTSLKLQGEYFRQRNSGTLIADTATPAGAPFSGAQSGWYAQAVYQFMPNWRAGLRYDRLSSGTPNLAGAPTLADFPILASHNPARTSLMVDYSPSEFSRFRLQFARDKSRPDATDNQIYLQYIMSLGAHGAHTF